MKLRSNTHTHTHTHRESPSASFSSRSPASAGDKAHPAPTTGAGPISISLINCLTGTGGSHCANSGGSNNLGFYNRVKGTGSVSTSFPGVLATQIPNNTHGISLAGPHISPNGAVGSDQYLQYANLYVQAYNTTTGNPILITSPGDVATPQAATTPFNSPLGVGVCNQLTDDSNVDYDPFATATVGTNIWIIAGVSGPTSGPYNGTRILCIAVSTTDDLGNGGVAGSTNWSAYAYDLTPILPSDSTGGTKVYDLADYPRFGVWNDGYYMTFDFIDNDYDGGSNPNYGRIDGSAVCKLDETDIEEGNGTNTGADSATCYTYEPSSLPPMIHTILPANAETSSYPAGTQGNSSWPP